MEANGGPYGGHGLQSWLNGRATEGIWGFYEGHLRQLWTEHESQQQSDKHVKARELKLLVLKKNTIDDLHSCPPNWINIKETGGCFHLASNQNPMTWNEADEYCKSFGDNTFLAEIHDEFTNAVIFKKANEVHSGSYNNWRNGENLWWLGAQDTFEV